MKKGKTFQERLHAKLQGKITHCGRAPRIDGRLLPVGRELLVVRPVAVGKVTGDETRQVGQVHKSLGKQERMLAHYGH